MKKLILFSFFTMLYIISFSQTTEPYYSLHDDCEEHKENCWTLGLCWDEESYDVSTIGESDILFTFHPFKSSNCSNTATYRLKPISGEYWQYNDANINIKVKMEQVETIFGYQLYDLKVKNNSVNDCEPKTFYWKAN